MSLSLLFIPYAIFLLIFGVFALIDIYHAWRFRSGAASAIILIGLFLIGTFCILSVSSNALAQFDWTGTISTYASWPSF